MSTKMALVVRTDLGMGKGKIAAQAAHAAVAAVLASIDTTCTNAWLDDGQPKVVLRVPNVDALLAACAEAEAATLPTERVERSTPSPEVFHCSERPPVRCPR